MQVKTLFLVLVYFTINEYPAINDDLMTDEVSNEVIKDDNNNNNNNLKTYTCSMCEKTYSSHSNLKRHLVMHTGSGHPCSICEKVYYSKYYFKYHLLSHAEKKQCRSTFFLQHICLTKRNRCNRKYKYRHETDVFDQI